MRDLRRFVQRGGLGCALLIGGVLGGLLAPLPSDAVGPPTLTLQIDGQPLMKSTGETVTGNSILGPAVACSTADVNLGYTACYAILTSTTIAYKAANGRLYRIQNAPSATARLRVGDNVGQDNFSLVGVQFVPVLTATQAVTTVTNWGTAAANTNEQHILAITMRHKFDSSVNVNNATGFVVGSATVGQLAYGMRSGGEFRSAPLSIPVPTTALFCTTGTVSARCNPVGDSVVFTGTGIFSGTTAVNILSPGAPTANNSKPLSLTVGAGSAASSIVSYDGLTNPTVGQISLLYPKFDCKDAAALTKCQPDITLTMTVTLKGPDTFVLVNGGDAFSAICTTVDNGKLARQAAFLTRVVQFLTWIERFHPSARLHAIIAEINVFLTTFNSPTDPTCPGGTFITFQMATNALADQIAFMADGAVPADIAPPAPPANGTLTAHLHVASCGDFPGCVEPLASWRFLFTSELGGLQFELAAFALDNNSSYDAVPAGTTYGLTGITHAALWEPDPTQPNPFCTDGASPVNITGFVVGAGAHIQCHFYTRKINPPPLTGTITITKRVPSLSSVSSTINFLFTIAGLSPVTLGQSHYLYIFCCSTDGTDVSLSSPITVLPGTYRVEEYNSTIIPGGWRQVSSTCDGGPSDNLVVQAGDHWTCIFTNEPIP